MVHDYFVYMLLCSDTSYYVGVTNDMQRRLAEHQNGGSKETSYTNSRRPIELVYLEHFEYINDAIAREKQIKNWGRKSKQKRNLQLSDRVAPHLTDE